MEPGLLGRHWSLECPRAGFFRVLPCVVSETKERPPFERIYARGRFCVRAAQPFHGLTASRVLQGTRPLCTLFYIYLLPWRLMSGGRGPPVPVTKGMDVKRHSRISRDKALL